MFELNKPMWWLMIVIFVALVAVTIYNLLTKGEPPYIMFTIASALSASILKQVPLFIKYKYLNVIPTAGAVIFLALAILEALKN